MPDRQPTFQPRVLSLFAGIGGIDLGLEALGCKTVAYSEIDPYASSVMALRFPDALNLGDVTTINWSSLDARPDIIAGGFPCQDISLAGKGAGIDGERSGLWNHYARAIRELRPRGVLVENVSALASRGLDRVLGDLAALGYDAEWDCIPAAALGAPHLRDRLFIVAYGTHTEPLEAVGYSQSGRRGLWSAEDIGPNPGYEHASSNTGRLSHRPSADPDSGRQQERAERHGAALPGSKVQQRRDTDRLRIADQRRVANNSVRGRHRSPEGPLPARWEAPKPASWWKAEPSVGRVVDGLPRRVDRLRCLGNAVVPQVAEHVGRILLDRIGVAA